MTVKSTQDIGSHNGAVFCKPIGKSPPGHHVQTLRSQIATPNPRIPPSLAGT
jgi:hypothetical protein